MKTVTIPAGFHPLEITINNTKYVYREGETVDVPDEVAALIEQYNAAQPVPKPNSLIDNLGLAYQRSDKGKALKVKEDGSDVEWAEAGSGSAESSGGGALIVGVEETDSSVRLKKTWKEIHDAMAAGQVVYVQHEDSLFLIAGAYKDGTYDYGVIAMDAAENIFTYYQTVSESGNPSHSTGIPGDVV